MVGVQKHNVFNRWILMLLFALVGFVLGNCAKGSDSGEKPEGVTGNDDVRTTVLRNIESQGLAQVGEASVETMTYDNYNFNGCRLLSDTLGQSVAEVDPKLIKVAQTRSSPSFASPTNNEGKSCADLYKSRFYNYVRVLDHESEKKDLVDFLKEGCAYLKRTIEAPGNDVSVEIENCTIEYKREEEFSGLATGSVNIKLQLTSNLGEQDIDKTQRFFLSGYHWVEGFDEEHTVYTSDSDGNQTQFKYRQKLSAVSKSPPRAKSSAEPLPEFSNGLHLMPNF